MRDGGGRRYVGRAAGERDRQTTARRTGARNARHEPSVGIAFVHTVVDDHSRIACAEIHDDEKAVTAIAVLRNAVAWCATRGASIERVLTDNGSACTSPGASAAANWASDPTPPAANHSSPG